MDLKKKRAKPLLFMEPIWKGVTPTLLRLSPSHLWRGSPSFPLLQSHHACTEAPSQDLQHLLGRKPSFPPLHPLLPTSRLNAHVGAPSPNTSATAVSRRKTKHLETLLVRRLPSLGGLPGGSGAAGHSPRPRQAQPRPDSAQPGAGPSARSPSPCAAAGLRIPA